jgi:hypothetical protein
MDRNVPFDPNHKCDICGKMGAYDFMGDYICDECLCRKKKKIQRRRKAIRVLRETKDQGIKHIK